MNTNLYARDSRSSRSHLHGAATLFRCAVLTASAAAAWAAPTSAGAAAAATTAAAGVNADAATAGAAPAAAPVKPPPLKIDLNAFDASKKSIALPDGETLAYIDRGERSGPVVVLIHGYTDSRNNRAVRIEVTGYTDTVGTAQYNLRLSVRRADAVRDYLARAGIPANRMDVAGKGETDLRVQTPDGVREPQNRRVEIIIP